MNIYTREAEYRLAADKTMDAFAALAVNPQRGDGMAAWLEAVKMLEEHACRMAGMAESLKQAAKLSEDELWCKIMDQYGAAVWAGREGETARAFIDILAGQMGISYEACCRVMAADYEKRVTRG